MTVSFSDSWNDTAYEVHELAKEKGWWEEGVENCNKAEMIALMHSELSEALEGLRHGDPPSDKIPDFSSTEEELADVIIRIMDYGQAFNLRIGEAMEAKIAFNRTRSHKHGGKKF